MQHLAAAACASDLSSFSNALGADDVGRAGESSPQMVFEAVSLVDAMPPRLRTRLAALCEELMAAGHVSLSHVHAIVGQLVPDAHAQPEELERTFRLLALLGVRPAREHGTFVLAAGGENAGQ